MGAQNLFSIGLGIACAAIGATFARHPSPPTPALPVRSGTRGCLFQPRQARPGTGARFNRGNGLREMMLPVSANLKWQRRFLDHNPDEEGRFPRMRNSFTSAGWARFPIESSPRPPDPIWPPWKRQIHLRHKPQGTEVLWGCFSGTSTAQPERRWAARGLELPVQETHPSGLSPQSTCRSFT